MTIQYAYAADITKVERDDNGDLIVFGKATGPDLDLDEQICDADWLKTAMPRWAEFGNIREMHQPICAGVGLETEASGDDWFVKSKVLDPLTAKKIEGGGLKGYSVGIKSPVVVKDDAAPGGRIVGGEIVEISYVDRPCNPTAKMAIAKAVGADTTLRPVEADPDEVTIKVAGAVFKPSDLAKLVAAKKSADPEPADAAPDTTDAAVPAIAGTDTDVEPNGVDETGSSTGDAEKRAFTQAERDQATKDGAAMSDGSFPIKTVKDLRNAIKAVGRAKDPAAAKKHIKQRAKKLNREDLIPEDWKAAGADLTKAEGDEHVHDPAELAIIRSGLIRLLHAELDELDNGEPEIWDIEGLLCSLRQFLNWWDNEAWAGETESPRETPKPGGAGMETSIEAKDADEAVEPDTTKTTEAEESTEDTPDAVADTTSGTAKSAEPDESRLTELVKSAVAEATKALTEQATEERKTLEAKLKTVEDNLAKALALPEPGGPVLNRTATQVAATKSAVAEKTQTEIRELLTKADNMSDPYAAQGYRDRAATLQRTLEA